VEFTPGGFARRIVESLEDPQSADADIALAHSPALNESHPTMSLAPTTRIARSTPPPPRQLPAVRHTYARLHSLLHDGDVRVSDGDVVFLVAAYDVVLAREPDDPGFLSFARHLAIGGTRLGVLSGMLFSEEHRTRFENRTRRIYRAVSVLRRVREATRGHWQLYVQALAYAKQETPSFPEWRFDSVDRELTELRARQFELAALIRETARPRTPSRTNGAPENAR
jgi:hypothetical protein